MNNSNEVKTANNQRSSTELVTKILYCNDDKVVLTLGII